MRRKNHDNESPEERDRREKHRLYMARWYQNKRQREKEAELLKTVEVPESAPRIELSEAQPEPAPEPLKGDEGAEPGDAPTPAEEEKPKVSEAEARPLQLGWRLRARRDLLFLLRSVLRYRDVTREVHGPIL